jgi:hypothetical protein
MPEFSAAEALRDVKERTETIESGGKAISVAAAIIAVLAALATLYSNHSSVSGLEKRTLAGIMQTRAADQYSYYESSRIKIEIDEAMAGSGAVRDPRALARLRARIAKENAKSSSTLGAARAAETSANDYLRTAELSLGSYERYEVAATLFDVSIVLVSITAIARATKTPLWIAAVVTVVGLGYFIAGFAHV